MAELEKCPACGLAFGPDTPDQTCPACALRAALELSGAGEAPEVAEQPGDQIGPYRLLERIGEGGHGVVYRAEQSEPLRRQVALKIVKPGMDTRQVIARFEAERQALALMEHPNIAKVFDAGATETGRPYFVMELVQGIKVTDYCNQHSLSIRQRLDLFILVCSAVQHAHQKGIIHRDLKPSNILVTQLDGVPVPKVIDFGIAKATGLAPLTERTLLTSHPQCLGTPAYMSPEQATLRGTDVDTRSDIYALGVLLYELLTGQTPFDTRELLKLGLEEVLRTIREKEPLRPSTRLRQTALARAATVHAPLPTLQSPLATDLDWIVMKCLEKDRARRYPSADALAEDLRRHLQDEPVMAAGPGAFYRLNKFVRRHRQGVAIAGVFIVLAVGGLVWQTMRMRQAARQTRLVAKFFEDSLKGVRSAVASGRDPALLRELLDQASARVGTELTNQPVAQASVLVGIGFLYTDLREFARADGAFRQALEIYASQRDEKNRGVAAATFGLALVSLKQADYAQAEVHARKALALSALVFDRNDTVVAHSLNCLAGSLEAQDRLPEAEQRCREALVIVRKLPGDEDLLRANTLTTLGKVLVKLDRSVEAEAVLREALGLRQQLPGDGHRDISELRALLNEVLERPGKRAEADAASGAGEQPSASRLAVPGE